MKEIKKVAIYIRVSTLMQDDAGSLDIQKAKMLEYCSRNHYEVYEVYSDVMSGASQKRKAFKTVRKNAPIERV